MKKKLLTLFSLISIMVGISGQDYVDKIIHVWGGMFYDQSPLIIDQNGNIYLAGMFLDTIFFGSKDNYLVPLDSVDSFITKINPDGSPAWTKVFSGSGHEYILDIAVNEDGFIFLIGDFSGTIMIDTVFMETVLGSDSYLCKLDPEGNLVELTRNSEDGELLYFSNIELDANGRIYLTGVTEGDRIFGLPFEPNEAGLAGFTVKLDSSINAEWIISLCDNDSLQYTGRCNYSAILPDQSGNIYLAGFMDADPDFSVSLSKVQQDSIILWINSYAVSRSTRIDNIFIDENNDVYLVGHGTVYFPEDTVSGDATIVKLDANGEYIWSTGLASGFWTCVVDQDGYTFGTYFESWGILDGFMIIDPDGNIVYNHPFDKIEFQKLAMDTTGNVYYNGLFLEGISIEGQDINPQKGENYIIGRLKAEEMIGGSYIDNSRQNESFQLYPNPSNGVLTIKSNSYGLHTIEIISLNGRVIKSMKMDGPVHHIDLSSLAEGIYIVNVRSQDSLFSRKLIKL